MRSQRVEDWWFVVFNPSLKNAYNERKDLQILPKADFAWRMEDVYYRIRKSATGTKGDVIVGTILAQRKYNDLRASLIACLCEMQWIYS